MKGTLTTEQLLKPRYKCVADYPNSPYRISDVLQLAASPTDLWDCERTGSRKLINPADYPAIFRKLEWWEDRSPYEMPEYLKRVDEDGKFIECSGFSISGEYMPTVVKVKAHFRRNIHDDLRGHGENNFVSEWKNVDSCYGAYLPATEAEYTEYINTQNPKQ